ncbi:MAG: hypothetical protein KGS72_20235 [Cyanobacteria bacterium REEB67]|nr:hypothetical protein [Cyanobacteria bacterium REEB67]
MTKTYEVAFNALQTPVNPRERALVVARAIAALVSSRFVRRAGAAIFFDRRGEGATFIASSSSAEALLGLPPTYGSVLGHFGEFERAAIQVD